MKLERMHVSSNAGDTAAKRDKKKTTTKDLNEL